MDNISDDFNLDGAVNLPSARPLPQPPPCLTTLESEVYPTPELFS